MGSASSSPSWAEARLSADPAKEVALLVQLVEEYELQLTFNNLNDGVIVIHNIPEGLIPLSLCRKTAWAWASGRDG